MGNLLTPGTFWATFALSLYAGEYFGHGPETCLAVGLPFLWARFCYTPVPTSPSDVLDVFMTSIFGVLGAGAALSYAGYGKHFLGTCSALWAVGWALAPSRSFPSAEEITKDCDLSGKVVYITGPTSGIGSETARVLAKRGADVILASRSRSKLEKTKAQIDGMGYKSKIMVLQVDLGDQDSIRSSIDRLKDLGVDKIDILINNAGIMALPKRRTTKQSLEMQIGVNHVGHQLLTTLLVPYLKKAESARVVCLSSIAHYYHDDKFYLHPKLETEPYNGWVAYGNAKLANLLFAQEFNERYSSEGITAYSVHPGGIFTGLQDDVEAAKIFKWLCIAPFFFKTISQGAATTLFCATNPDVEENAGQYFENCGASKRHKSISDENAGKKLWETTEKLLDA